MTGHHVHLPQHAVPLGRVAPDRRPGRQSHRQAHRLAEQHPPRAHAARTAAPATAKQNTDNDFDYDLFNGRVPQGQEAHGVRGEPVYAAGAGFDPATKTGRFQLAPASPGAGAGQPIPNFSDGYTGPAPDIGAHQRGAPDAIRRRSRAAVIATILPQHRQNTHLIARIS